MNPYDLMSIPEASQWASEYQKMKVTTSNINYLIQYGRISKYWDNGSPKISKEELRQYYHSSWGKREINWKAELGDDINWALSFDTCKEADTTKHVHRLHPYKGKFIPQLVEYFIDSHTDEFKKDVYFKPGDIILDPFCGSGTALVQANELGIHAIGIDISAFNALISNVKVETHPLVQVQQEINKITKALILLISQTNAIKFDAKLTAELNAFNQRYFPSADFKSKVRKGLVNQEEYGAEKEKEFALRYHQLVREFLIQLEGERIDTFLDRWYLPQIRQEMALINNLIHNIQDENVKQMIQIILSRTVRTCRATTHADLATLIEPVHSTYYCAKHGKVCKPLFTMLNWWKRYCDDTLQRLVTYNHLRTATYQYCISGDARKINILQEIKSTLPALGELLAQQKIRGIFSSPPYIGLIDYHEQHAYAYELFGFQRKDNCEIGAMAQGQGKEAKEAYVQSIADVLKNNKKFLVEDYHILLVANDKFNLYPSIVQRAGMRIVNQFRRPVLNRTEKDKSAYAESIFHIREA